MWVKLVAKIRHLGQMYPVQANFFTFADRCWFMNLKKILTYSFLVLFLFNSIGYYILFELSKYVIQSEMQAAIHRKPSKLTVISVVNTLNDRDFQRLDKKEFRYKGLMYDVVREIKTLHATVFICIHDTKESNLYAGLKRVNHNRLHFAMIDHLIMVSPTASGFEMTPFLSGKLFFSRNVISLPSSLLSDWSPPPECC
jgi:hypothetical protein